MRNLTKPSQYGDLKKALPGGAGTVFAAGTEQLELLTPAGDKVLLAVHTDGFLYVNGEPYGMIGMPPAFHAAMHNTADGTDPLTPGMIGAAPATVIEEIRAVSFAAEQKADDAVSTSIDAKNIAESANVTATGIASTANMAFESANNAFITSTEAKKIAEGVDYKATQSFKKSDLAEATANRAETTAENALSVANGIDAKATEAMEDAASAVATAEEAKEIAEGIDAKASQGINDAAVAYELANTANIKANTFATTESAGIVLLNDSVSSTSIEEAATAHAVKTAYDLADTAHTKATTPASASNLGPILVGDGLLVDAAGKLRARDAINIIGATSGTIPLATNTVNRVTINGTTTFSLPAVDVAIDNQIVVYMHYQGGAINFGTPNNLTGGLPSFPANYHYILIWQYLRSASSWAVGAIRGH